MVSADFTIRASHNRGNDEKILPLPVAAMLTLFHLEGLAQSDFKKQVEMTNRGSEQEAFIGRFAQQAKDRNSAAILKEIEPMVLKESGEAPILQLLQSSVFPFFANYSKLHTYKTITNALLPDGRTGLMHYTYVKGRYPTCDLAAR